MPEASFAPALLTARAGEYVIFLRDFVTGFSVGIHPHEQERRQRIRINVDLIVHHPGPEFPDDIAAVVSYESIVEDIRRLTEQKHINLIESLAERIAALCLHDQRVRRTRVQVEKLEVFPEAVSVGVVVERGRDAIPLS
ncbi:7,8-dihydroneopterin aldolase/epimerase/oxygenase [uncultured Gammaproteobacteria bacterium]